MRHHAWILLLLVLAAAGCQKTTERTPAPAARESSPPPVREKRPAPRDSGAVAATIQVVGVLSEEGVECPALRGDDGKLYTLTGDLHGFKAGDRVKVTGSPSDVSICQQGTTLNITSIVRQ